MMDRKFTDHERLVSQADLIYDHPVYENFKGLAVGNGVTGSIVWMEPDRLKLQVNRVDVFSTNGATAAAEADMAAWDWLGTHEYCGGCGFLDISFGEEIFTEGNTTQHLRLYDGELEIKTAKLKAELKVWAKRDVFCLDVEDNRNEKLPIKITLSMLRPSKVVRKGHSAISRTSMENDRIGLTQEFSEVCDTGIAGNDHYCASAVYAQALGCTVTDAPEEPKISGCSVMDPEKDSKVSGCSMMDPSEESKVSGHSVNGTPEDPKASVTLTVLPGGGRYSIYIASGASFVSLAQAVDDAKTALREARESGEETITRTHRDWWHEYWSRSYIDTSFDERYSIYWHTYLYYIASCMRGQYPAKFNGSIFNGDGDYRRWGGQFWWYNQSRFHYGLDIANHGDMNHPLYHMLLKALPRYQKACEQVWGGHGGVIFPETEGFSGPEILPEEIAADLRNLLLCDVPATEKLLKFMGNRSGMNSRWAVFMGPDDQKKKDAVSFRWHSNLSYNAGDVANSMWNHYLYTMDPSVLERIYPWLKGVAEFYRYYPLKEMGEDGCYHFHHLGWAESIPYATDVIDDLVMMRGIFPTVIKASQLLGVDEELRPAWEDMLRKLPPYPDSEMEDSLSNWYHPEGYKTYAVTRKPGRMQWKGNTNDCRLRMLHNYDLVNLETRKNDQEGFEIANHSFEATEVGRMLAEGKAPCFSSIEDGYGFSLNRGLVEAARLGRTDIVRTGLPALLAQFTENPYAGENRVPWPGGADKFFSIQEIGVFADQIQEPLLQSISDGPGKTEAVIHVFPAWPMEWDVSFELLAKGAFLVHSKVEDGKIPYVQIFSQKGGACHLHNPWPGHKVEIISDEKRWEEEALETITFDTAPGKTYQVIPA